MESWKDKSIKRLLEKPAEMMGLWVKFCGWKLSRTGFPTRLITYVDAESPR